MQVSDSALLFGILVIIIAISTVDVFKRNPI